MFPKVSSHSARRSISISHAICSDVDPFKSLIHYYLRTAAASNILRNAKYVTSYFYIDKETSLIRFHSVRASYLFRASALFNLYCGTQPLVPCSLAGIRERFVQATAISRSQSFSICPPLYNNQPKPGTCKNLNRTATYSTMTVIILVASYANSIAS